MPFDPTKPYEPVAPAFDPSKPFEPVSVTPEFDPRQPFDVVKGAGRDTSRDSYEAQLADLGLTEADAAEATRLSDRKSDLLVEKNQAARTGQRAQNVADIIDFTERAVVEPLSRPISGAFGRAADAFLPEGYKGFEKVLQQPTINLPRVGEAETVPGQIAAGIYNAGAELIGMLSSPDALALLPAAANRTVLAAWISQMAGHQPQRVLKATQLFKEGKTQEAVQEVATGVGELGLAELGRRHVMGADQLKPSDVHGLPKMRFNEAGEVFDPLPPDLIARNNAAPGTLRPQEIRGAVAPQAEPPPGLVQLERTPVFNRAGEVVDVQVVPRVREVVYEEPSLIEPVTRFVRPDPEGGKLPGSRKGFERTAEDFIEARPEPERPAETIEPPKSPETKSPAANVRKGTEMPAEAGATPAPESALTPPPEVRRSPRPETITAPDARLGAESPDGRGLQMTERMAAAGAEAPAPVSQQHRAAGKASAAALESVRPPDILDFIQDSIGRIRKHTLVPERSRSLYDAQEYRTLLGRRRLADKIFSKGGVPADVVAQAAFEARQISEPTVDALWRKMEHAASVRANFYQTRGGAEAQRLRTIERQADNFDSAQRPSRKREVVTAGELFEGAKFKLNGEDFVVEGVEFNPETLDVAAVRVKDGPKFGEQTLSADTPLRLDKGSLKQPKPDVSFNPEARPGIVSGTGAEAWADRTIQQARGRVHSGIDPELFAAYVVKGAAHLERGVRKFSAWSAKMLAEHGDAIRPHLRRIFEEAQRGLARTTADLGALKQRKLAARGSGSKDVAAPHREQMKTGRESFYEPQDMGRVEDLVSKMTSEELGSVPLVQADGPMNVGVAARLEAYRRLVAADNLDAAWALMAQTMKEGTSLGQAVNQFKMLRGATPDGVLVMLNKSLLEQGYDPVPPAETLRIRRLAEESIKANARWKEAERQWKDAPTDANLATVEAHQRAAIEADSLLQEKLRVYQPRSLGNTLSTLFKGNLIAPISQMRNVVGNSANLALRGGMRTVAVGVDAVDAMLRSRPRTRAMVGLRGTKEAAKAAARSLPDAVEILKHGGADRDLAKADTRVGLRPLLALRDAIALDALGPKKEGKTPIAQRLIMALEASPFGMHAAAQLRTLGAMDKPFREAAKARLITEHLKVQDINNRRRMRMLEREGTPEALAELDLLRKRAAYTSANVAKAVKFPELFIDKASLARIEHEAATAVFQNRNPVSQRIHGLTAGAHPMVRFMFDTVVPFVTTPVNVIGEWLSYNPAFAAYNLGRHAYKGEARLATQAAGKFVVGSMAFLAGQWLYQKGLVSPSLDQSDEQQKARILSGQTMPPSRLNLTGLERALNGGDGTWRAGDRTVDILSAGGVLGAVFQNVTDVNRRLEREPEDPSLTTKAALFGANYAMLTAGYGVNQSFLQGTSSLLEGLSNPARTDSWLATYLDGLSAIALPNTLNAITRATRENKPELRGDSLDERLNNQIKSRISGVQRLAGGRGADADLPLKRDLWGRPLPATPPGAHPFLTHFLDVTKSSNVPTDPLAIHLYNLWRRTADNSVIPAPPDRNFSIAGLRYELNRFQESRLQELVGQNRHALASRIVDNPEFFMAPASDQISALKAVWTFGNQVGSLQFFIENREELKEHRHPAGFEPAR